jgi:methionine synthase I (cobalamin-dependent)
MDFLDELQQRVLPGDGAMGTELLAAGVPAGQCLEELCVSQPDLVRGIHEQYIAAGARIIETNSFGANVGRLAPHGLEGRVNELNWTAAQLAKDAAKGTGVYVAGSVGPLGITAAQAAAQGIDRHSAYLEQIGALLDGGCNLIFLETFLDVDELIIALNAKHTLHHCPVVALLSIEDPAELSAAVEKARGADADLVGVNCVDGSQALGLVTDHLSHHPDHGMLAAFPSAGLPQSQAGRLIYPASPEAFAAHGLALAQLGVRLIGGCCGIGPGHIAALAKALAGTAGVR